MGLLLLLIQVLITNVKLGMTFLLGEIILTCEQNNLVLHFPGIWSVIFQVLHFQSHHLDLEFVLDSITSISCGLAVDLSYSLFCSMLYNESTKKSK